MRITEDKQFETKLKKISNEIRTDFPINPKNAKRKEIENNQYIRENLSVTWKKREESDKKEKVLVIGINPSRAQNNQTDLTMTKVCRFLDMYGFDNVSMLNLYEGVSPWQSDIPDGTETDFSSKKDVLERSDIIIIAWGMDGDKKRKERKKAVLEVLKGYSGRLYSIKNPRGNYPAHPSRMSYASEIIKVEIETTEVS